MFITDAMAILIFCWAASVTPDNHLGKISDYFHFNNKNNQLER